MTNPIRLLALQTPQQCDPENVGRSTAVRTLSPEIAAGMCAGLSQAEWAVIRACWAGDTRDHNQIERLVYIYAADLAHTNKWRLPKGKGLLRAMTRTAIAEHYNPLSVDIPTDTGRVRKKWSGTLRAELCGMGYKAWHKTWAGRYELIYRHMQDMKSRAYSYLKGQE